MLTQFHYRDRMASYYGAQWAGERKTDWGEMYRKRAAEHRAEILDWIFNGERGLSEGET